MDNIETLQPGTILNNTQLCEIFGCSPQGGMRPSNATNTLVLVVNHVKSIYDDRWKDDVLFYTGSGRFGDMTLEKGPNKKLNESPDSGIGLHLFEVFIEKEYTYLGEAELVAPAETASQPDENGALRLAWLFPLKLKNSVAAPMDPQAEDETYRKRERQARRLSDEELRKRARQSPGKVSVRRVLTAHRGRSPYVAAYAKRRAAGSCELCQAPAPFHTQGGEPYLECHHIEWLARGGEDTIENTVALCPNCHRRMHVIEAGADINALKEIPK